MASGFHSGNRSLQDRFDTRALADRIDTLLVRDTISACDRGVIHARDMFLLATADADGRPTCSYKGGEPRFVRVLDSTSSAADERHDHEVATNRRPGFAARKPADVVYVVIAASGVPTAGPVWSIGVACGLVRNEEMITQV